MALSGQILAFLVDLPATDSPEERKALVAYTGFSHLGIYLDWQGSQMEFFPRLLEQLGRRGKATFVKFLDALPKAPQVEHSQERKQTLSKLSAEVEALDEAEWQRQFGVAPLSPEEQAKQPIDADLLALTVVTDVLTPFFRLGADELTKKAGEPVARMAGKVWETVEAAIAGSVLNQKVLRDFQQQPGEALNQGAVTEVLKEKLRSDESLRQELSALLAPAEPAGTETVFQTLIDVAQQIETVSGTVVGAAVGNDALQGLHAKVKQDINKVEQGGTVVGAVVGGSGSPMNIGGQHQHGGIVHGNVAGRNQYNIDSITSKATAIGEGSQAIVHTSGLGGADVERLFQPLMAALQRAPADKQGEAVQQALELQQEVAKGKGEANDKRMANLIEGIAGLVPGAVSAIVSAFGAPLLAGIAGPVTDFVLEKIGASRK
jgi:hypothetical protein